IITTRLAKYVQTHQGSNPFSPGRAVRVDTTFFMESLRYCMQSRPFFDVSAAILYPSSSAGSGQKNARNNEGDIWMSSMSGQDFFSLPCGGGCSGCVNGCRRIVCLYST